MKYLPVLICLLFLGCKREVPTPKVISSLGKDAYGQYLTKDNEGNVVLSWLEEEEKDKDIMYFAVSEDGKTFGKPVKINATLGTEAAHGECPPKIGFKSDGSMYVIFALKKPTELNQWAGNIYYISSADKGKTWSEVIPVDNDTNPNLSRAFFDISLLPDGELGVIWLKGKDKKDTTQRGSSVFFASTAVKSRFGKAMKIQDNTCECCRTDLFTDSKGVIHATFRAVSSEQKRDMVHCISQDNGKTFSEAKLISNDNWIINGCPHVGPDLTEINGQLQFVWFTMGGKGGIYSCNSTDNGSSFTERKTIVDSEKASHPQISNTKNGKLVYVWDENFKEGEKFTQKIGLRIENEGESNIAYIDSADHVFHPLIMVMDENNAVISYTKKQNNKEQVIYQKINL